MLEPQYSNIPLDQEERSRVRFLQIGLKAVKTCRGCGLSQLVYRFPYYGAPHCEACMAQPLETWWADTKARLAAAS